MTCNSFSNISIALRIMLTIPITRASAKRNFSKLKIIKNTLVKEILSDLAIILIENEICENLDYDNLITTF